MTHSLTGKLTLAFVLVALLVAALVAVFIRASTAGQLDRLIVEQGRGEFKVLLINYYQSHGSWAGIREYALQAQAASLLAPVDQIGSGPGDGDRRPALRRNRRELFGVVDAQGRVVVPLLPGFPAGARVPQKALARGEAIEVDGRVVGTILTATLPPGLNPEEAAYLRRTRSAILLAGGGAVLVALVMGVWLARTLTRPLQALTQAAHRMASGELEQEVPVESGDEIGELAAAFNRMSRAVARANTARRQMTADVAHELRTPLTVVGGYVEAMREGVLAPTPERLAVIHGEIERLQHLVGDLRTLSQADAGELKLDRGPADPVEMLRQARAAFEHQAAQKGVSLELEPAGDLPAVQVDETRMAQVLGNLISNALRFTSGGGRIALGAAVAGDRLALTVQDTGQGISPEDLPFVFDRMYRGDKARGGESGESGLGLAIARALVEAHGGALSVQSAPGAGSTFAITLPV